MEKPGEIPNTVPSTESPQEFLEGFYQSSYFKDYFEKFFKDKTPDSDVTEEEKRDVFLNSEKAKSAFLDYAKKEKGLKYNPIFYSQEAQEKMNNYISSVKSAIKASREGSSPGDIITLDSLRSEYHTETADQLVKDGITPSHKLGRAFARLVLISKGLETFEQAVVPDIKRINSQFK